jgi:hypothetical protein
MKEKKLLTKYGCYEKSSKNGKINNCCLLWVQDDADMVSFIKKNGIKDIEGFYKIEWSESSYNSNYQRLRTICNSKLNSDNADILQKSKLYFIVFKGDLEENNFIIDIDLGVEKVNPFLINIETKLINNPIVVDCIFSHNAYEYHALLNLVLGYQKFRESNLSSLKTTLKPKLVSKDIEGSSGWCDLSTLFNILNLSCNWLVLRNYEELSNDYVFENGDDIDILCENNEKLVAIVNAQERAGGRCAYMVNIKNMTVLLDIRFIGDKYYDPAWEKDMLNKKEYRGVIPVLSNYNYFFALIYHTKLQKTFIKEGYSDRLDSLAKTLNFKNLPLKFIYNDTICSKLLDDFFIAHGYHYTYTDNAMRNEIFLKLIRRKEINDLCSNCNYLARFVIVKSQREFLRLPARIKNKFLRILKIGLKT